MSRRDIPDLMRLRRAWKRFAHAVPMTTETRIGYLVWRTKTSEANRRVKLENRPDAAQRIAGAKTKRKRKGRLRRMNANFTFAGLRSAKSAMRSHW